MTRPIEVLLQTTIETTENDWHVGRFSMLEEFLANERGADGAPLFSVTARDRGPIGTPDPVLSELDRSSFDELWLFGVDVGHGLEDADRDGIDRFRQRGGGLMLTRDHMDLGCSICSLPGIGAAHLFHTHNLEEGKTVSDPDDIGTPAILWPNFHSGSNGDFQVIEAIAPVHPVLRDPAAADGVIRFLPSHPHEGAVVAPAGDPSARAIAIGTSKTTGARFNTAVVFEATTQRGRALAESTFHHFADYNWDTARGSPDFVSEQPGGQLTENPEAAAAVRTYVRNVALWLAGRDPADA